MKYTTDFTCKKAIIVDREFLEEVQKEILAWCNLIKYEANLENGDKIEFESLEELITFENSKLKRIKDIEITARNADNASLDQFIIIQISAFSVILRKFIRTIYVSITIDDVDKKTIFENNMRNIFVRHEQNKWYNIISRTGILNLIDFIYFIFVCIYFYKFFSDGLKIENDGLQIMALIFAVLMLLKIPIQKGQEKYFEPIVFYSGDEKKSYDDKRDGRKNFFGGVIVAGIFTVGSCIMGLILT